MKSIKEVMLKEHARILSLLIDFENSLKAKESNASKIFSKFHWNLEKHFFIEEKVIFTLYNPRIDIPSYSLDLLKDHKEIQWQIKLIEDNMKRNLKVDINPLKTLLIAHAKFEDEDLYPKIEEELPLEQKQEIIERSEEIIGE